MANVSQKIQTFLGGVSRKADFDKIQGQVVEANNCYPDETYGMIKRPGTELLGTLGIDFATANDLYFFPIIREGQPRYLCGVGNGTIRMWSLDDPSVTITVTTPDGTNYLNHANVNSILVNDAYRAASDDRRTIIVNRTKTCAENNDLWSSTSGYTGSFQWTDRIKNKDNNSIDDLPDGRAVRVNWGSGGDPNLQVTRPLRDGIHYLPVTVRNVITKSDGTEEYVKTDGFGCVLKCNVTCGGVIRLKGVWRTVNNTETFIAFHAQFGTDDDGNCTFTGYHDDNGNTITTISGDRKVYDAEIWSAGSGYPDQCPVTIDGIEGSRATLATGLLPAQVYRVVNSGADTDDFYMQPFSNSSAEDDAFGITPGNRDRLDGPYVWKECPSPDSKRGLDPSTLPHELVKDPNNANTFIFRKVDYSDRWAGDDNNNPAPSFSGSTINNVFFQNNRLGFLSEDNIILSRPINYGPQGTVGTDYVPDDNGWVRRNYTEIDFFRQSAISLNDADPIDIKAANNNVSIFHTAINTPQGTILFADGQQSLLFQPQGLLSPLTASINSLSNYDMTGDVNAVIVGEKYYFVNKSAKFCRIYSMINQGMQNPPIIEDVTKEVADWLPNDMTDLVACPTDNMIFVFNRTRNEVYARREIGEGSSWVKWRHSHPVVSLVVDHDLIFFMTSSDTDIQVSVARLYLLPDDYTLGESRTVYPTSEFTSIPQNYNYYNSIVGDTVMAGNYSGVIECYKPWHSYYGDLNVDNTLDDTFDKWLPWQDTTPVSALISVSADETAASEEYPWNVGFKLTVRSTAGSTVYSPSSGSYFLPYDTKFRLRNVSGPPNDSAYDSTVVRCDTAPIVSPCSDPEQDECCNYIWIQNTDGTEYNTGIQAKSFEVIPDGDEVIVKYVACSTSTFDPLQYTYVRYVGKLTNTEDPVYGTQYGSNIGLFLSDDGSIITSWKSLGTNQTNPKTAYFVGSAYVKENSFPYYRYPADTYLGSSPFTDSAGTLTYPPTNEAWRANVTVTNTGNASTSGPIFVGDIGAYGANSSVIYPPSPSSGGAFGMPDFRGGLSRDTGGNLYTVQIQGKWEFTNDTSEGTQVTWGGINNGITSTDFEFTRRYSSSTFKTAYLRVLPTDCCGCPTEPVPPIILNTLSLDPNMDLYTTNVTVSGTTVTPPASFPKLTSRKMTYVIANLPGSTAVASDRAGDTGTLTWNADHTLTADTDLSSYATSLIIGYRFDYHLVLPTFYYNQGNSDFDYTASLTVSRVKFALGLSGQADFEINVRNGPGWESSYSQIISNEYLASTAPLSKPTIVSVPIHKRNSDFQLQVKSDSPFPLSVDSCMWEGNYSPRYYRRT